MGQLKNLRAFVLANPLRLLPFAFAGLIGIGTLLLLLPFASADGKNTTLLQALFTATSAVCVTGLTVVDTSSHWSGVGQGIILLLVQLGGLGIVTVVSVAIMLVSDRIGLAHTRVLAVDVGTDTFSSIPRLVRSIVVTTLAFELIFAVLLSLRFFVAYDYDVWTASSHGVFHSISAWNNAGFALYDDSVVRFVNDWFFTMTISIAVILGGLGFPVLRSIGVHRLDFKRWSLHSKLMVSMSIFLLASGTIAFLIFEWSNQKTLGGLSEISRPQAAFFHSVQTRSGGFNTVDVTSLSEESMVVSIVLMFIGGGSASTAGGIKATTFALLAFVMWAEVRGDRDVHMFKRRIPEDVQRQALTVSLAGVGILATATLLLMTVGDAGLGPAAFEAVSALATVGLSTGVAANQGALGDLLLIVLMFIGRIGPVSLAAAITLRSRPNLFRYPTDRPLIG
jgi:potassium uptake TrkH family protein